MGRGVLKYDDRGDFANGQTQRGAAFTSAGQATFTMQSGLWTRDVVHHIVAEFLFHEDVELHVGLQQPRCCVASRPHVGEFRW